MSEHLAHVLYTIIYCVVTVYKLNRKLKGPDIELRANRFPALIVLVVVLEENCWSQLSRILQLDQTKSEQQIKNGTIVLKVMHSLSCT